MSTKFGKIRQHIAKRFDIDLSEFKLIYQSKPVEDHNDAAVYDMHNLDTIHMVETRKHN